MGNTEGIKNTANQQIVCRMSRVSVWSSGWGDDGCRRDTWVSANMASTFSHFRYVAGVTGLPLVRYLFSGYFRFNCFLKDSYALWEHLKIDILTLETLESQFEKFYDLHTFVCKVSYEINIKFWYEFQKTNFWHTSVYNLWKLP